MTDARVPVWLDCDPGHDDAFAVLLAAYHPAIQLLGISTVFGNASLEKTTHNVLSILTAIGKQSEIPVFPGAAQPLVRPPLPAATDIHGESGLDGTDLLPAPRAHADTSLPAVDAMARALRACPANTAWVVATGATTNVARLLVAHPDLSAHLKGVSLMGGAVGCGFTAAVAGEVDGVPRIGNWTPWAEFNIVIDPEAAAAVLQSRALRGKVTLVPLDVTHLVLATEEVQSLLLDGPGEGGRRTRLREMFVQLLTFFAETYKHVFGITAGPPLHDPLAVAAVLTGVVGHEIPFYEYDPRAGDGPKQGPGERYQVTVVTDGTHGEAQAGAQTGRTIVKLLEPGVEGVRIPRGLDIPHFWKVIEECIWRADLVNANLAGAGKSL